MKRDKEVKVIGSEYLHVSNSGVTFSVIDEGHGPTIAIDSSAFGNLVLDFKVYTDKKSLLRLAKLFMKASDEEYSEDYCHKAD